MPLALIHTFCIWHDATKPCPQRREWQATCGDSSCQNCDHAFVDVADFDVGYLAGEIAVQVMTQLPAKSGRRRLIMSREHCQMSFADVDMDRVNEYSTGEFYFWTTKGISGNYF